MSELDDQLELDEQLWSKWLESGVTETTQLAVDFIFYATSQQAADQLAEQLRELGLHKVEITSTRTLIFWKGWEISAVEQGTWSLQKLHDRTRRYMQLAEICHGGYDGCGAMIDPKTL